MADPSTYRPAAGTIPVEPGVYRFRDDRGRVVYVGKAKSLRSRLSSYFQDVQNLHPRTRQMVTTAASVEWTVVATEVEALQLEYTWIKEFDPRFNVKYRDDKSYPSLAVTLHEDFPRLQVMRGPKKKGVRYFGPYSHAWAIRETLDLLLRVFPGPHLQRRGVQAGRPGRAAVPARLHRQVLGALRRQGEPGGAPRDRRRLLRLHGRLVDDVRQAAREADGRGRRRAGLRAGRPAARRRRRAEAGAREADRRARPTAPTPTSSASPRTSSRRRCRSSTSAAAGCAASTATSSTRSRTSPPATWSVSSSPRSTARTRTSTSRWTPWKPGSDPEASDVPREVLVPAMPPDADAITRWLRQLRGTNVELRVPQRGDKKALMETVERNAKQAFALHKTKRASDLTARCEGARRDPGGARARRRAAAHRVLRHLQPAGHLGRRVDGRLRGRPGAQVGVPPLRRRGVDGQDDTASMHEVLTRRFARYLEERGRARRPPLDDRDRAGRGGSPTRRTSSSSTAACRRSPPPSAPSTSSASTTSRWSGWPSGSRRSGCPVRTSR